MTAAILATIGPRIVPGTPPVDIAVAENFERFDGFEPTMHPAALSDSDWVGGIEPGTLNYPRPGQLSTPVAEQTYTPSSLYRTVGTLGGQPYPARAGVYKETGDVTLVHTPSVQWRLGVGQHGPSSLGAANTVQLSEITSNPPQPGDLASIIAGLG